MRKTLLTQPEQASTAVEAVTWLDLEEAASVELSSEDPQHPFEQALQQGGRGWRASTPGPQTLRLRFDSPRSIKKIHLDFREVTVERLQEITLRYSSASNIDKEVIRQQWTFSPAGSTTEVEDYNVDLRDVTMLELQIDPGKHDTSVFASLQLLRIG